MQAGFSLWVQIAVMTIVPSHVGRQEQAAHRGAPKVAAGARRKGASCTAHLHWRRDGTRRGSRNQVAEDQGRVFRSGKAS